LLSLLDRINGFEVACQVEADASSCLLLKSPLKGVIDIHLTLAKEENSSSIKSLVDHCFVKSLLNRIRVVIGFKNDEVTEKKWMYSLLATSCPVALSEF
jgi:hypothetical protein